MPSFRDRLRLCVLTVFRRGRSTGASSTSSSSSTRRAPRASHASRVPHVTARSPLLRKLGVPRNNGRRFPAPFLPLDPDVPRSGCPGRRPAVGAARLTCRALPDRAASGQLRLKREHLTQIGGTSPISEYRLNRRPVRLYTPAVPAAPVFPLGRRP